MQSTTIIDALEEQIKATPHKCAVRDENRELTFSELGEMADTIKSLFPDKSQYIGIIMDHSVEMIAAIFAVLKSGAAYIPIEPSFPLQRIKYMMEQSGTEFVITQEKYVSLAPEMKHILIEKGMGFRRFHGEKIEVKPQDLAYVLYTSGTTGHPKGVSVEHRNVCNYVRAFNAEFHLKPSDVMLQNSVCTFDIFVEEVFPVLAFGGTLVIPSKETRNNLPELLKFIESNNVTIVSGFPYLFEEINNLNYLPKSIRLIISGGDVLKAQYLSNLIEKVEIYNTYGPTETTVCCTYFRCDETNHLEDGTYPVGKPVQNVEVKILDNSLQCVSPGDTGEICIFGEGVSRGYLGNGPENEVFSIDEYGNRFYRSGDLGYYLEDGNIVFIKRKDAQVMIKGKRVEPQELEHILEKSGLVNHAAIVVSDEGNGNVLLDSFVVPTHSDVDSSIVKDYLTQYVPEFMMPQSITLLEKMPLNANGKIDKRALRNYRKESQ